MLVNFDDAVQCLQSDPVMAELINTYDPPVWRDQNNINMFADVVSSIISQQLSVKVADIIETRVLSLLPGKKISPEAVAQLDTEAVRACGVSYAKIKYMKSAAEASLDGLVCFETLHNLSDEDVIAELIKIHGVGRWTAEMLLMFSLQRPDVFSIGDLGLRTAVSNLYKVERSDIRAIESISSQWSPYRTIASRYLWQSLNNTLATK